MIEFDINTKKIIFYYPLKLAKTKVKKKCMPSPLFFHWAKGCLGAL
jgi:hypothetical protein